MCLGCTYSWNQSQLHGGECSAICLHSERGSKNHSLAIKVESHVKTRWIRSSWWSGISAWSDRALATSNYLECGISSRSIKPKNAWKMLQSTCKFPLMMWILWRVQHEINRYFPLNLMLKDLGKKMQKQSEKPDLGLDKYFREIPTANSCHSSHLHQ